jgi:hypothetical protein
MKNVLLLLWTFSIYACGVNHSTEDVSANNQAGKLIFPDSLVFHLPQNNKTRTIGFTQGITASNAFTNCKLNIPEESISAEFIPFYYLEERIINSHSILDSIQNVSLSKAIAKIKVHDKTYFIIDKGRTMLNKYNRDTLINLYQENAANYLLMNFNCIYPSERNWIDPTTTCGLTDDFTLYIFKYGTDAVLKKEYLYDWDVLPKEIKHGYSCGIAISEKKLIVLYWVLAW